MGRFKSKRRILIVGEGRETEYNYFVGFRRWFESELEEAATSVSVKRGKGGDAAGIVRTAIKEARNFGPVSRLGDRVFLLLDTEGAGRAPELPEAERLARKSNVEIVYSCPAFEYWLLCHFANAPRGHFKDCDAVIEELDKEKRWQSVCNDKYHKADQIVFDRLSGFLEAACVQALEIDRHHLRLNDEARCVNPSTQVYELIATLIGAKSGERCPITGAWKPAGDKYASMELKKGDVMPNHNDVTVRWHL